MKKWLRVLGVTVLLASVLVLVWIYTNIRDRNPDYSLSLNIQPKSNPTQLKIGFSAFPITPEIIDTWTDTNGDARYNPEEGDTFEDNNNNGVFDAVWMAGFQNGRPAQGVHDDLWARTMLIDDGNTVISFTALDAIGFGHDEVLDVRKIIADSADVTYAIISSTHTHEAPDLQGLWGPETLESGVDPAYMQYVKEQAARSVLAAYHQREAASLEVAQDLTSAIPLVTDSREPTVLDPGIRIMHAIADDDQQTLGSLVSWGNHPETLWNKNLQITSDFPHYLREGVEKGIQGGDSTIAAGLGGICVFMNAAIGGLMTTDPDWPVEDTWQDTIYLEPTFEKAASQGKELAYIALKALQDSSMRLAASDTKISLLAKSFDIPLDNPNFRLASAIGLIERGQSAWMQIRTEVSVGQIGPISFLTAPGEIYPEIINGGVENPIGQDFEISAVETPPLRSLMPGSYRFVFGLANDQIGYIIPKSEWDEKPPYIYGAKDAPYGEVNSVGPDTAPSIYRELQMLLEELTQENISHVY